MRSIFIKILLFIFLVGCAQNTLLLGPSLTLLKTGSVHQSAISQGVNLTVKKKTGKSINEHLTSSLDKKAALNNKKKCENINKDQFMDIFFENEEEKNCKNIN
jgi:hypothetical protein